MTTAAVDSRAPSLSFAPKLKPFPPRPGLCDDWEVINGYFFSGVTFGYEGQKPLFKNLDFGIDMDSRSELVLGDVGCGT